MNLDSFIPKSVRSVHLPTPWSRWLPGSVLFADVSGFTPMSEALSTLGVEGAEILTDILNRYFAVMIKLIHSNGGEVMKFGGDAILCFFPGEGTLHQTLYTAKLMQEKMDRFQRMTTPVKKFSLKMKIGVASGDILLGGVGDPKIRCDYLFAGKAVDLTSDAEHHATADEVVLAQDNSPGSIKGVTFEKIVSGFYRILDVAEPEGLTINKKKTKTPQEILTPYIIPEIYRMVSQGYGKHVGALLGIVPVFFKFTGFTYTKDSFDLQLFHDYFSSIMEITTKYNGRLNRISMGDKGSTFLFLFGAPNPLEKKEQITSQWAIDLKLMLRQRFPETTFGIGMNSGKVFTGIVGGGGRWEYTVMGDAVNFAARIMQGANDYQICSSVTVENAANQSFEFHHLGKREFKGKSELLSVYEIKERRRTSRVIAIQDRVVGRTREVKSIVNLLEKAESHQPGMLVLEGDPGVGKSYLATHILHTARKKKWLISNGKGEISRQSHPYAPWAEILHQLLFGDKSPDFNDLTNALPEDKSAYLAWFADFLQIPCPDSIAPPPFAEEVKKNLFHHQLSEVIMSKTVDTPLLLFLDDLHWFDTLSKEFLASFLNHFTTQAIFILSTTRSDWDKKEFENRPACHIFPLKDLDHQGTREIVEDILKGKARESLIDYIFDCTKGNPFLTRQLLEYFKSENFIISRLDEWMLSRDAERKGALSGEDVIVAQMEKLSLPQKAHLRFAACIGSEFTLDVLKSSMGKRYDGPTFISLVESDYFQPQDHDRYSFPHALIQETIYHIIPNRIRRQNHKEIGSALESLHKENLSPYFTDLADHYLKSTMKDRAIKYAISAGHQMNEKLSFPEACKYFKEAYSLLKFSRDQNKWKIALELAKAYRQSGKLDISLTLAKRIRQNAKKHNNKKYFEEACAIQFESMERLGDFGFKNFAKKMISDGIDNRSHISHLIGVAYYREGQYTQAENYFNDILTDPNSAKNTIISTRYFLASIYKNRKLFDEALSHLIIASNLAKANNDLYQEFKIQIEHANVMIEFQLMKTAKELLINLLNKLEQFGDFYLLAGTLLNLGNLQLDMNEFDESKKYLNEASSMFHSMGIISGQANSFNLLGILSFYQEDYEAAYQNYLKAILLFEKTNEMMEAIYCYYNLAEVCVELKRIEEAREWCTKGIHSFDKKDDPRQAEAFDELLSQIDTLQ